MVNFLNGDFKRGLHGTDLDDSINANHLAFTQKLNEFYKQHRALWEVDHQLEGIEILDADNKEETALFFIRKREKTKRFSNRIM